MPVYPVSRFLKIISGGIRLKLTLVTLVLIGLITTCSSLVVIRVLDDHLLQSLIKRGNSIALSAATPAAYSILANDPLALDNLAAKIEESQQDILYLAILDVKGNTLAHSSLEPTKRSFIVLEGKSLAKGPTGSVQAVTRNGRECLEFSAPIQFANSLVGQVIVGIDAQTLDISRSSARNKIVAISLLILVFGLLGTFFLSNLITTPIERLASGVSKIKAGDYRVNVPVTTRDELGDLTHSFNEMSQVIMSQKDRLEGYAHHLEEAYVSTVRVLAAALDARDNYTYGHSARVARLALLVGTRLGLEQDQLKELEMACFLHDIGKIHVPDMILNKELPLNQDEYEIIKRHPVQGAKILNLAESLHKYIPAVLHHHEWYNGGGYPDGLKGEEIHPFAQIVAIADSYDAMMSSRPYRQGCTRGEAAEEIRKFRGTQYNPELVDAFLDVLKESEDDPQPPDIRGLHDEKNIFPWPSATPDPGPANLLRAVSSRSSQKQGC